jgi:hypothetical protein
MDNNEAFSEWFEKQYGAKPQPSPKKGDISHSSVYMTMFADGAYKGWQAAQQQSTGEIAELEKIKGQLGQNVIDLHREVAMLTKNNANLKADNERLREALEDITTGFGVDCVCNSGHSAPYVAKQALSSTPSQSLQAHDEVKG